MRNWRSQESDVQHSSHMWLILFGILDSLDAVFIVDFAEVCCACVLLHVFGHFVIKKTTWQQLGSNMAKTAWPLYAPLPLYDGTICPTWLLPLAMFSPTKALSQLFFFCNRYQEEVSHEPQLLRQKYHDANVLELDAQDQIQNSKEVISAQHYYYCALCNILLQLLQEEASQNWHHSDLESPRHN